VLRGLLIALGLVIFLGLPTLVFAQEMTPTRIAETLIARENAHDVEGAVALFTDDAVVNLEGEVLTGTQQIRVWQQGLATGHFHGEMSTPQTAGDHVIWRGIVELDRFRELGLPRLDGIWDLTLEGGKIKAFTFTWPPESRALLQQAATPPPGMPRTGNSLSELPGSWLLLLGAAGTAVGILLRGSSRKSTS
jgi:hypothetical protein